MTTEAKRMGEAIAEQIKMVMEKVHPDGTTTRSKAAMTPIIAYCPRCAYPAEAIPIVGSNQYLCALCSAVFPDNAEIIGPSRPLAHCDHCGCNTYRSLFYPSECSVCTTTYRDRITFDGAKGTTVADGYVYHDEPKLSPDGWCSTCGIHCAVISTHICPGPQGRPYEGMFKPGPVVGLATVDQVRAYVEACLLDVLPAAVRAAVVVTDYRTLGTVNVDIGLDSKPPYPDDRALVREQAQTIATLQATVERLTNFDRRRAEIAWGLFRIEVQDEVWKLMEPDPLIHNGREVGFHLHRDWDRVLLVMWTKTKLDVRARCEAKAEDIAMMMGEPPEVGP